MSQQIEQLRTHFNLLPANQKKKFITKLYSKIQGKNLPTYTKFLHECANSYNALILAEKNAVPATNNTALSTQQKDYSKTDRKRYGTVKQ